MTDIADASHDAVERDLGRCPVMHLDVAPALEAGSYWRQANELREAGPAFFNTYAQGYWVFTRHEEVREIYRDPELFSSESITPWEPEPVYRFVPTQIDPPDHLKYRRILNPWFSPAAVEPADPMIRALCRQLIEDLAPSGSCDFVTEFALRYPTEVFLTMHRPARLGRRPVRAVGRGLLPAASAATPTGQESMVKALTEMREYWAAALAERRGEAAPRDGDLASHLLHATVDDQPLAGGRDPRHADGARARRARHDPRLTRVPVPAPGEPPGRPAAADRGAGAGPDRRSRSPSVSTRSSSATAAR